MITKLDEGETGVRSFNHEYDYRQNDSKSCYQLIKTITKSKKKVTVEFKYHKIPIIGPGLIVLQKSFCWAYFRGSLFSEERIIGGNLAFQNGLGLTIKTASTNSPWAYIREGLLSEGYLRLRFGGLIFGRTYLFIYLFIYLFYFIIVIIFFFLGGGGGLWWIKSSVPFVFYRSRCTRKGTPSRATVLLQRA